jgi:hypothetical protein
MEYKVNKGEEQQFQEGFQEETKKSKFPFIYFGD